MSYLKSLWRRCDLGYIDRAKVIWVISHLQSGCGSLEEPLLIVIIQRSPGALNVSSSACGAFCIRVLQIVHGPPRLVATSNPSLLGRKQVIHLSPWKDNPEWIFPSALWAQLPMYDLCVPSTFFLPLFCPDGLDLASTRFPPALTSW